MNPEKIGKFIYKLRTEKGLSQYQLADMIPISRQAVSKWERAQTIPDSSTLIKLSEIFDVSINELLKGERLEDNSVKQLEQTTLNILDESNEKTRKIRRTLRISTSIITILVLAFLLYYFVNSYNTIKVYTISGESNNFILHEGIFITTKEKTYMKLGKAISPTGKEINNIKVYYENDGIQKIIFKNTESDTTIIDLYGYEENFPEKDMKFIAENSYMEITYDDDKTETIHLIFDRDFENSAYFFMKNRTVVKKSPETKKENFTEQEIVEMIQEKGINFEDNYVVNINDDNNLIQFSYFPKINQIMITIDNDVIGTILMDNNLYTCLKLEAGQICEEKIKEVITKYLKNNR